jgi:hypothetical protein
MNLEVCQKTQDSPGIRACQAAGDSESAEPRAASGVSATSSNPADSLAALQC